jgi:excisionase family DNA binding protein
MIGGRMKKTDDIPNCIKVFLTASELSARWKLTIVTLRRWRREGRIQAHVLGRNVRFSLAEVERLESAGRA